MSFQIVRNDITRVKADAIVNTELVYGDGNNLATYEDAEAPALDVKYIIHTVEPIWDGGDKGELDTLKSCYEESLNLALKLKCKSIAFPLIAAGIDGFPKDKALQIAISVIQSFLFENNMKVILVVFDRNAFELSGNVVDSIREYVDANYDKEAEKQEYPDLDMLFPIEEPGFAAIIPPANRVYTSALPPKIKIDDLIASSDKTFQEKLFEIIDERGLTGPQVYKNYISKQVFSKLQANKDYHPNKYTAIALCLSLHLDIEQTQDLIGRAGWALSPSNKADLVVKGCILNQEYNVVKINCILFDFDCPELEKIK